jgi:hypothetical protein
MWAFANARCDNLCGPWIHFCLLSIQLQHWVPMSGVTGCMECCTPWEVFPKAWRATMLLKASLCTL